MARTIKDASVKSFHYTSMNQLRSHVREWLTAYNLAKQLKALGFKTPCEPVQELWQSKPDIFIVEPSHKVLGLNTLGRLAGIPSRVVRVYIGAKGHRSNQKACPDDL